MNNCGWREARRLTLNEKRKTAVGAKRKKLQKPKGRRNAGLFSFWRIRASS
jgi:hypothetical protein